MPKGLKILAYIGIALFSFIIFFYLTFPLDTLTEKFLSNVEAGLKGQYSIDVGSVSPRLIAGALLKSVKVTKRDEAGDIPVFELEKVRLKTSIFSLISGNPVVRYDIRSGEGRISGRVKSEKESVSLDAKLDGLDLGQIGYLAKKHNIKLSSAIDGDIKLEINQKQPIRSSGEIKIEPNGIKTSEVNFKSDKLKGFVKDDTLPEMTIGAGKSEILLRLEKGSIKVETFRLEGGDLNFDLTGMIYLSQKISNSRLNLRGKFTFSEKIYEAIPFLYGLQNQKGADGTYPLTIAGRVNAPQIKIGDFTVPL